jgi:hypothetical protein
MSVRRIDRDRLHGRDRVRQVREAVMDMLLMCAQGIRVHSSGQLGRAAHDEANQLEILGGLLLLDIERPRQALIGQCRNAPVRRPGRKQEQDQRKDQSRRHRQPDQPDRQRA